MKRALLVLACLLPGTTLAQLDFRYIPTVKLGTPPPRQDAGRLAVLHAPPEKPHVTFGRLEILKGSAAASNEELIAFARSKAAEMGAAWMIVPGSDAAKGRLSAGAMPQKSVSGRTTHAPALTVTIGAFPAAGMAVEYLSPMITGGKRIVGRLLPGSKAADGGLASGDEILTVNGMNIDDPSRNAEVLLGFRPGGTAEVSVKRAEKVLNLKIPLVAND